MSIIVFCILCFAKTLISLEKIETEMIEFNSKIYPLITLYFRQSERSFISVKAVLKMDEVDSLIGAFDMVGFGIKCGGDDCQYDSSQSFEAQEYSYYQGLIKLYFSKEDQETSHLLNFRYVNKVKHWPWTDKSGMEYNMIGGNLASAFITYLQGLHQNIAFHIYWKKDTQEYHNFPYLNYQSPFALKGVHEITGDK